MITLYDYFRSTACYRVRIALNLKKINYETISINLIQDGGQQYQAEYTSINPQNLVPTLVINKNKKDKKIAITQSLAILEYLEEQYPTPPLLPVDLIARANARTIAQLIACDIHPLNNLRVLQYITTTLGHNEQDKLNWYQHWMKQGFTALEKLLITYQSNPNFCIGNSISIADICLIPQVYNAKRFNCDMNNYPRICRINQHCLTINEFITSQPNI